MFVCACVFDAPLEMLDQSLILLPEKEFGSVFFDNLRTIILFEADCNQLQTIVFSRKMPDPTKNTT